MGDMPFTYFMTKQRIAQKLRSFSQKEFDTPTFVDPGHICTSVSTCTSLFNGRDQARYVENQSLMPNAVSRNRRAWGARLNDCEDIGCPGPLSVFLHQELPLWRYLSSLRNILSVLLSGHLEIEGKIIRDVRTERGE